MFEKVFFHNSVVWDEFGMTSRCGQLGLSKLFLGSKGVASSDTLCYKIKMFSEALRNHVKEFPKKPGVYLMTSGTGKILYIGKASSLRARVSSYFSKEMDSRYQIRFLMSKVQNVDFIVTHTPKEALLLENTLIKKHRPRYNIELKDGKSFVSLKLSIHDEAPRLYVTRQVRKDGGIYYGPYASAGSCREVVGFIQNHFRLRTCSDHEYRNRVRPCLQYQIKKCDAPCVGIIPLEEYQQMVSQVRLFLEGKSHRLKKIAKDEMMLASQKERYEEAARYRDLVGAIDRTFERQKVVSHENINRDVLGFYREAEDLLVNIMMVRGGALQGHAQFPLHSLAREEDLLSSFLTQYYREGRYIPAEILLPFALQDQDILMEVLSEHGGRKIRLHHPQRGTKASLSDMATENAREAFFRLKEKTQDRRDILISLQEKLQLVHFPERIECYDISNIQGEFSVGSMVTFMNGEPCSKLYRRFNIQSVQGANDFASLYEVLRRRMKRASGKTLETKDEPWSLPDLIIIDGGKGQLNAALQALKDAGISGIEVISLAKSRLQSGDSLLAAENIADPERSAERVFLPNRKNPVLLPPKSSELFLLMRARDEAHRFGIEAHRKFRQRSTLISALDQIDGVGKLRRENLLKHFGSLKRIKTALVPEIAKALGGNQSLAKRVKESL